MSNNSLIELRPNENAIISGISNCGNAKKRLYELGLNTGTKVTMVKNDIGPIILSVHGHKLALGRGLASKIIVG
ncbi:MAG: FeoA domain-containing protein [Tissierellaceae bacterium]|nr:FeoA domain-containing protein [Tissierellaceae bacterium]